MEGRRVWRGGECGGEESVEERRVWRGGEWGGEESAEEGER